jgi:hypothetical protein
MTKRQAKAAIKKVMKVNNLELDAAVDLAHKLNPNHFMILSEADIALRVDIMLGKL